MMRGVWKGFVGYAFFGGLWRLAIVGVLVYVGVWIERSANAAKPRLDGEPSVLREALGFPWKDFPSISEAERSELANLIPLDPAIRMSDIRPWTVIPTNPALGSAAASRNAALSEAFAIIDRIRLYRQNPSDPSFNEAEQIAEAKKRLTAAQGTATPAMAWLIHYNRGVVYGWENNRQREAREFENAYRKLAPRLESASVADEVRSAAIHALYGWGNALIEAGENAAAIDALRSAAFEVTNHFHAMNPSGVSNAAGFYELAPTGLSTRSLRNDLLAAYLGTPTYSYCKSEPLPDDVCETGRFQGLCRYRDERFCKTKGKNPLQGLFEAELKAFVKDTSREATVWALQNALEIEAENALHDEPVVAYNVAKLLHDLQRPDLAYQYIHPITTRGNANHVTPAMVRLGWVSSILANERVGAMPQLDGKEQPSGYRIAYQKLHPADAMHEPPPFQPLQLEDAQKGKNLDAWLFIRRYRHLLSSGDFETFIHEHRKLNASRDASTDFLDRWKSDVVVDFLQRTAEVRKKAQPATKGTIDRFLSRSELFTDEELKKAKVDRPFNWWTLRWLYYLLAIAILALLARDFVRRFKWSLKAYESTFVSAYQRDRRARAG